MKKLNYENNIKNFLYDLDYFITIYENYIDVFNYEKLIKIDSNNIKLEVKNMIINIDGKNFSIKKMSKEELLLKGIIEKVEFNYEKDSLD